MAITALDFRAGICFAPAHVPPRHGLPGNQRALESDDDARARIAAVRASRDDRGGLDARRNAEAVRGANPRSAVAERACRVRAASPFYAGTSGDTAFGGRIRGLRARTDPRSLPKAAWRLRFPPHSKVARPAPNAHCGANGEKTWPRGDLATGIDGCSHDLRDGPYLVAMRAGERECHVESKCALWFRHARRLSGAALCARVGGRSSMQTPRESWCPRRESNPHQRFRKPPFYPLNYGDC